MGAIIFGSHQSQYFPNIRLTTSLSKSQIPTFEEFLEVIGDDRYDWRLRESYLMVDIRTDTILLTVDERSLVRLPNL